MALPTQAAVSSSDFQPLSLPPTVAPYLVAFSSPACAGDDNIFIDRHDDNFHVSSSMTSYKSPFDDYMSLYVDVPVLSRSNDNTSGKFGTPSKYDCLLLLVGGQVFMNGIQ